MTGSTSTLGSTLQFEQDKLLSCIHCGLCLEACPTYFHTGDENDSPRGRIYLMRAVEEKRLPLESPVFARHINRCLGCRACEQACPAGVEYGALLEAARDDLRTAERSHTFTDRVLRFVLRHVWLQPRRLRLLFVAARLFRDSRLPLLLLKLGLPPRLSFPLAMLASSSPVNFREDEKKKLSQLGGPRAADQEVSLFTGCVTEGLFARTNRATARVLRINGCDTAAPPDQVCCGALHAHAGDLDGARQLARRNIDAFAAGTQVPIITNAGGCGAMLQTYGHLLEHDAAYAARARAFSARVRDVSQQLELTEIKTGAAAVAEAATYDASCHLLYGQRAATGPLKAITAAGAPAFNALEGADVCCGGAGIYNILQPELSEKVLGAKLANIQRTGARVLATGNPGCHMQIGAGAMLSADEQLRMLRVCHPVELLDESYMRAGFYGEESE